MRKSFIAGAAVAVVAALIAAPAAAIASDEVTPDAPVVEAVVEAPVAEETTVEVVPEVEEVVAEERAVAVEQAPVAVQVAEETKTIKWILPAPGTPENVTWPQPIASDANLALIPCGETRSIQVDVYPYTSDSDKARTDGLGDTLEYGEDHGWVKSWSFETFAAPECPPVVTNACTAQTGTHSTNLNDLWANVDTRSAGHVEYIEDGLHVWTDDNSSQAKVSEGMAVNFALKNTGTLDLAWSGSTPPPGINLFVNFGADGSGTLVYESVYGQDLWLTNGSSATVKGKAPVNGGGNGSQRHGTIDQWLSVYPDAQVVGLAYSLGSGVKGDGVISSITAGCATHTFDFEEEPVVVPEQPEPTVSVVTTTEVDCDTQTALVTTTTTTSGRTEYDAETNTWVAIDDLVEVTTETRDATEAECPAVVIPPTDEPTPTPTPTTSEIPAPVAGKLAVTGGNEAGVATLGGVAAGLLALGSVLLIARRRQMAKR